MKNYVVVSDAMDFSDPHDYCGGGQIKSARKKQHVMVCISRLISEEIPCSDLEKVCTNTAEIKSELDQILRKGYNERSSPRRVKRRLFRTEQERRKPRKSIYTKRNFSTLSTSIHFRAIRSKIGHKRINKDIFKELEDKNADKRLHLNSREGKRKRNATSDELKINTNDGIIQISSNTISKICKYHKNMVRKHPPKDRTKEEQNKRDKNTAACRLTRRAKKLEGILVEEQYQSSLKEHEDNMAEAVRSIIYMKALMELINQQAR